jgi:hypothetical protein
MRDCLKHMAILFLVVIVAAPIALPSSCGSRRHAARSHGTSAGSIPLRLASDIQKAAIQRITDLGGKVQQLSGFDGSTTVTEVDLLPMTPVYVVRPVLRSYYLSTCPEPY